MAGPAITIAIPQMPAFLSAVASTPKVQLRYMRGELSRGLKRMRKRFIASQLQGPPGIKAGPLAKGKNVFTFVSGQSLQLLGGKIGISRILHVHEKGMTMTPKHGTFLYLHAKGSGPVKDRPIVAVVPSVTIPARLHFKLQVQAEAPAMLRKVGEAGARATEVTLRKALLPGAR
jgi:hypothetical protein